jgi:DNA-binding transcriptional MerR regulator
MEIQLPAIPDKRYFTIGEVSELCGVKPHVLRYWEQEFAQLRPVKRRGNRRYYQHHEVLLIRRIRDLLYEQGFTISGARNRLADDPHGGEVDDGEGDAPFTLRPPVIDVPTPQVARDALVRSGARSLRDELLVIRALLDDEGWDAGTGK